MSEEILNNHKDGLKIFEKFVVDYSLPKWSGILPTLLKNQEKESKKDEEGDSFDFSNSREYELNKNQYNALKNLEGRKVDLEFFKNLNEEGLAILVDELKRKQLRNNVSNFLMLGDTNIIRTSDTSFINNNFIESTPETNLENYKTILNSIVSEEPLHEIKGGMFNKFKSFITKMIRKDKLEEKHKKEQKKDPPKKEEKKYILDVLEFFKKVKLETAQEADKYYYSLEAYFKALKEAQIMGQDALVDTLLGAMIRAKYESLLKAKGYNKRIDEEKLVEFIKQTKKGVSLSYVKNYSHPIPVEIINKKLEVDKLGIFDNYCILYYDPDSKVYSKTAVEQQKEREAKEDPILFGMLDGIRSLYYITDWKDKYCDLTLDKVVETLNMELKDFNMQEQITLR